MIKNYFRILKKPHAYLHTILKTPVKFQKDWTETVGGVKGTKYPLKTRNHAPRTTRHAPRATPHGKPKTVSLHFSSKRRGTTNNPPKKCLFLYWFYFCSSREPTQKSIKTRGPRATIRTPEWHSHCRHADVPNNICKDSAIRHPRFWRIRFLNVFPHTNA